MSKKIMKKSLALGALMAFVITGSAWANESELESKDLSNNATWQVTENTTISALIGDGGSIKKDNESSEDVIVTVYNYGDNDIHDGEGIYSGSALTNKNLKIEGVKLVVETFETSIYNNNVKIDSNSDVSIDSNHDDGICVYGNVEISAKNVTITANDNGIKLADAGELDNNDDGTERLGVGNVTINATDGVTIKSVEDGEGYAITNMSEINGKVKIVAGGDVVLESYDRPAVRVGYVYDVHTFDGIVDVTGENIKIKGVARQHDEGEFEPSVAYAQGAGKLNFTATETIEITDNGELETGNAIGAYDGGTVNINGAANVIATGNVYASGEGSKINFANAGGVTVNGAVNVEEATLNVASAVTVYSAKFDKNSTLNIKGDAFDASKSDAYALNGKDNGSLTVEQGAKIVIESGVENSTYNVAQDFATNEGANWTLQADNALWYADWVLSEEGKLQATIGVKEAETLVTDSIATNENKEILVNIAKAEEGTNPTVDAIKNLTSAESNLVPEQQQKAIAAVLQVGEAGGFTGNVVSVSKQVTGSVGARNSFTGPKHSGPRHRGGHGPSVTEENNGGAIWAQYVHGKDKVDGIDMGGVENAYESQFNGVVLGMDFKQVGSYASGIAFNYGEGDSHSKKNVVQSDSEFDFWGLSYYGAVKKQDTNFIFDIGYSESDSDVEQVVGGSTITANPEATTWTAGVKVEKLIDKGAVQIVPYTGLRYMSIDTDDYQATGGATGATYYSTERQDIWLLPVGVSLSQENVYDSGWIVTPKADLSYTWAMGDTDSSMTVNIPNVADPTTLGYTVMDDGSFMATVGLDAQKEDWTFGVAYSYQKGDSTRSDRWYVNARYSF